MNNILKKAVSVSREYNMSCPYCLKIEMFDNGVCVNKYLTEAQLIEFINSVLNSNEITVAVDVVF